MACSITVEGATYGYLAALRIGQESDSFSTSIGPNLGCPIKSWRSLRKTICTYVHEKTTILGRSSEQI